MSLTELRHRAAQAVSLSATPAQAIRSAPPTAAERQAAEKAITECLQTATAGTRFAAYPKAIYYGLISDELKRGRALETLTLGELRAMGARAAEMNADKIAKDLAKRPGLAP